MYTRIAPQTTAREFASSCLKTKILKKKKQVVCSIPQKDKLLEILKTPTELKDPTKIWRLQHNGAS